MTLATISRRVGLKFLGLGAMLGLGGRRRASAQNPDHRPNRIDAWNRTHDRVWLGGEFWANPMEDWRIDGGWAVCQTAAANRSIHSLTRQLTGAGAGFGMSVRVGLDQAPAKGGGAGFRVGIRSELDEVKSNCFAKGGVNAGIKGDELILGRKRQKLDRALKTSEVLLELTGETAGEQSKLTLTAKTADGAQILGKLSHAVPIDDVRGNIALVSQFEGPKKRGDQRGYRFTDWRVSGEAVAHRPEQAFGPILWSMYSLSDSRGDEGFVLKLSALTGPLGKSDSTSVALEFQPKVKKWVVGGEENLDSDAWTATFRLPNWDETHETPFRLVYREKHSDGGETRHERTGTIKPNPTGRPLRLGALTCQNDYAFPYAPVAKNLGKLDPDLLYFSGDQLYESHGGFGIIRDPAEPAILCYLRKFYQFGWAFGEAMRDRPTLCIPDDHDVFQGNIWGEGGASMKDLAKGASSKGGYREPARMVNVVHKTNAGHHPDPFDPTPCGQDISVYYGEVVYGGVSFAVLGDRQWKSGPQNVETGSGRADHVRDPQFDTAALDKPGLDLLGERQERFLAKWAEDWRGHTMKVLLSQTVFAGVATHHGKFDGYLKADLDSGGWPQTPRNRAVGILRKSMALHVNGDQHLTTLSQYGVEAQRDSNWSFCTPAIAAGYPRWWRPDEVGMPHENRPAHGHANTGEFLDGFGNRVYVYAVGNPEVATEKNRYAKAHQKGSGFGLVLIDPEKRTYTLHAFRFSIDATDGKPDNQFPGWPVVIQQAENRGMSG